MCYCELHQLWNLYCLCKSDIYSGTNSISSVDLSSVFYVFISLGAPTVMLIELLFYC